ncbi:MAG: DUF4920 domain-containing protein [Phycisphaerales bacterium]|nr:DUF4920 domain-containing protein [Phycisphaerales bacterium]
MCRTLIACAVGASAMLLAGCAGTANHVDFGEPFQSSGGAELSVADVLAQPDAYKDKTIQVTGTVAEVCKMRGCWMSLASEKEGQTLFVRFTCPIEGRLIPMEAVGLQASVRGTLVIEEVSEPQARHVAEDAGKSPEEVAKIVGPQKQVRIASPSARVMGLKPAKS